MRLAQTVLKRTDHPRWLGRGPHNTEKTTLVLKHRRVDRAHLATIDKGLCIVVGQETQKLARENQRGN